MIGTRAKAVTICCCCLAVNFTGHCSSRPRCHCFESDEVIGELWAPGVVCLWVGVKEISSLFELKSFCLFNFVWYMEVRGQLSGEDFSPTRWVLGIELQVIILAASAFTCWSFLLSGVLVLLCSLAHMQPLSRGTHL